MALDFPNSPTIGQLFPSPPTAGVPVWQWDGNEWAPKSNNNIVDPGAVRYDAAQTLTANQKAQARANIDALKKNYIVNGGMQVSQENGSASSGLVSAYYPVDQFLNAAASIATGNYTVGQVASPTPGGSPNRIRFTVTAVQSSVTAAMTITLRQYLEGSRIADLLGGRSNAKTFIVQFGVRAPAGTYCLAVWNGQANRYYIAEYTIAAGEANNDVVKSIVVPGDIAGAWPTDNTFGMGLYWSLLAGSNYQGSANAWTAITSGNPFATSNQFNLMQSTTLGPGGTATIFELFDVGLYEGSVAPSFQVPDFDKELVACQRYYEKSTAYAMPVLTASDASFYVVVMAASIANAMYYASIPFKVRKRAAATVVVYPYTTPTNTGRISNSTGIDYPASSGTVAGAAETGFSLYNNSGGTLTIASNLVLVNWYAAARM
jgi:hypothetical protein